MNLSATRLQRVLNEAPVPFQLGDYINRGFQFMNANFGMLLAFMLLSTIISFFFQMIPIAGFALSILIAPVLQIGYSQFTYVVTQERKVDFGEFFKGFSKIGPLVATYLLTALVGLAATLPGLLLWYQAGMWDWVSVLIEQYPLLQDLPDLEGSVNMSYFWLGTLLMVAGALVISVLFVWSLNVVWFFDVGPLEALNSSRKLIARNWGTFVLFLILCVLIGASGVLLCGIGILYTAPAMSCAQFFAFADAARLFEEGEEDNQDITDHLII